MDNDPQSISALLCLLFFIYLIYDSDLDISTYMYVRWGVETDGVELSVHMQSSLATTENKLINIYRLKGFVCSAAVP